MADPTRGRLRGCADLIETYDAALLDLDGVVYVGQAAVPGAPGALAAVRERGVRLAFVTNNASRTSEAVALHLRELGIPASAEEVVTSAQVAARHAAEVLPAGAAVLVVGAPALVEALTERGLRVVDSADDHPVAVVQGFSPDLTWRRLAEAAIALQRGARWIASNADESLPSERGRVPGNGAMVAALTHATGLRPVVVGKPHPAMHAESILRSAASRPLVVGDRLDTDIAGANLVGCDSMLVLSGLCTPAALVAAPAEQRPTFVAADVGGLLQAHPAPTQYGVGHLCGAWVATAEDGSIRLRQRADVGGGPAPDDLDALRAICAAAWASDGTPTRVTAGDAPSHSALERFGLAATEVDPV